MLFFKSLWYNLSNIIIQIILQFIDLIHTSRVVRKKLGFKYGTDTQLVVQSNQETLTNANLQSYLTGYLLVKDVFHYINIRNQAMYEFLTTYIRSFLWMFIYIGIGLLILGILSAMLSEKSRLELTR